MITFPPIVTFELRIPTEDGSELYYHIEAVAGEKATLPKLMRAAKKWAKLNGAKGQWTFSGKRARFTTQGFTMYLDIVYGVIPRFEPYDS